MESKSEGLGKKAVKKFMKSKAVILVTPIVLDYNESEVNELVHFRQVLKFKKSKVLLLIEVN